MLFCKSEEAIETFIAHCDIAARDLTPRCRATAIVCTRLGAVIAGSEGAADVPVPDDHSVIVEPVRPPSVQAFLPSAFEPDHFVSLHIWGDQFENGKPEIPWIALPQ